ncbi:MAG: AAA family ATPase [Candidatus Hydrogenedentes bacterium]|nr:AAA family ATPase [Candidatus Hydrogenedentota bacterium]
MLLEFSVSNFRSFKDEQTLSLLAGRDKKHAGNLVQIGPYRTVKCAVLCGANASGKSNLIRAIDVMIDFVRVSATKMTEGDKIPGVIPFRLSSQTERQPSRFGVKLLVGDLVYDYAFSASQSRVFEERLSAGSTGGSGKLWFSRVFDDAAQDYKWEFGANLREGESVLKERTRGNGLALSRGAEQNIKPLSDLFIALAKRVWVFQLSDPLIGLPQQTAWRMLGSQPFAERIVRMVRDADLSIEGLTVEEKPADSESLELIHKLIPESILKGMDDKKFSAPTIHTAHRTHDTGAAVQFDMEDESNGTRRFFAIAGPLVDAVDNGALVVIDELDCSMHPLLTRRLLELFQSPNWNSKGAQLIFTTHDSTLMNPSLFRRDQIWLVEKDTSGSSQLRSLYDFQKPRSTESFQRNYLAGRYGAVPNFGPILEDLETP